MKFKPTIFAGHPLLRHSVFAWNGNAEGLDQTRLAPEGSPELEDFPRTAPAYLLETEAGIGMLYLMMHADGVDWDQATGIVDFALTALAKDMGPDAKTAVAGYVVALHNEARAMAGQ